MWNGTPEVQILMKLGAIYKGWAQADLHRGDVKPTAKLRPQGPFVNWLLKPRRPKQTMQD